VRHIVLEPIDARALIARVAGPDAGAVLTFAGTVRDRHHGREVVGIDYHGYEPMAERELERLEREITARWPGLRAAISHRLGHLELGELSVLIAVASPHRPDGFDALRHAIEELKRRVPIWKRELYADGASAWLEGS